MQPEHELRPEETAFEELFEVERQDGGEDAEEKRLDEDRGKQEQDQDHEAAVAACSSERASVLSCSVSMRAYPATIDLPEPSVTSPQTNAWMPADSAAPMAVFTASGRTNQTMPTPMLNTR